ncbi:hypothetical protein M3J09_013082 [Ascochyta lentis]
MVYLQHRSRNSTCDNLANSRPDLAAIRTCQDEAKTPYCWPPNGTRICIPPRDVSFYWPPSYYDETSYLYLNYNQRSTPNQSIQDASGERLNVGASTYIMADENPDRPNERAVKITIHEKRRVYDSLVEIVHQGPTLILEMPDDTTAETSATASPFPDKHSPRLAPGTIAGVVFGALVAAILLGMLCFSCCGRGCCGTMGDAERKRARRQQALHEQREMDEAKIGDVATAPTRAAVRPLSISSDDIRVMGERVQQQRHGVMRADTSEPPPYDAPPPKYIP